MLKIEMMIKPLLVSILATLVAPAYAEETPLLLTSASQAIGDGAGMAAEETPLLLASASQAIGDGAGMTAEETLFLLAAASNSGAKVTGRGDVPASIATLLDKARYWKEQNRKDVAVTTWKRVLLSIPTQQEALSELSLYYAENGQMDVARDYLNQLKQANPDHPVVDRVERMFSYVINKPAWLQLAQADQAFKRGDMAAAEAGYNTALTLYHDFPEALLGLANVMLKQNKPEDAVAYLDKFESKKRPTPATLRMRCDVFVKKGSAAETARNYNEALSYYAKARASLPNDPWATLGEARMLRRQGKLEAANREINQMAADSREPDARFAGALYYSEVNQWNQVRQLLEPIPEGVRSEQMRSLLERADIYVKISEAKRLHAAQSETAAIEALGIAAREAEGKADLASMVANAWMDIGQPALAVALLETLKSMPPNLQLQYAAALLQAGEDQKLAQVLGDIDRRIAAASYDKEALENIRTGYSQRKVEALREEGKYEEGLAEVGQLLEKSPTNADLLLAKARLLGAEKDYSDALKEVDLALSIVPGSHDAIHQGVEYSIKLNDYALAERYLSGISKSDPLWESLYIEAGHFAQANDNQVKAAEYFVLGGQEVVAEKRINTSVAPNRQSSNSVEKRIPYLEVAYAMRNKSGLGGLSYQHEAEVPMAYHMPVGDGRSSLVFKATEVSLSADNAAMNLDMFGTNPPAAPLPTPYLVRAAGTAFSVGYQSAELAADVGVSPQGFAFNDVVGGVRWNKDIAGEANLALEVSRRSVTDSVLSYAGVVDNVTGQAWGGVSKSGVNAAVYFPINDVWSGYVSAGYYGYGGHNVAGNASSNLNASLIYLLTRSDDFEASVSARLSRVSFNNNQNYFTWGHGGYYSPQRDIGLTVPVHLTGTRGKLTYEFNLSVGFSNVIQDVALTYPTNPVLQAGMGAAGMNPVTINYGKRTLGADWTILYEFAPQLTVGNRFHYDESLTYQQMGIMLFVRYDFEDMSQVDRTPPYPIKPYYLTTQGGAGLN